MFDVERVTLGSKDDPKIKEITTRISRFAAGMELDQDKEDKVYIIETEVPISFTRYTPSKVESTENIYLMTEQEAKKNGSRIYLAPGVLAAVMFFDKKLKGVQLDELMFLVKDYFAERIERACTDRNDILIGNKKVMGITVTNNETAKRAMIHFVLTMKAEHIRAEEEDFFDKKYEGIAGVCDETKMTEDNILAMIDSFILFLEGWRTEWA